MLLYNAVKINKFALIKLCSSFYASVAFVWCSRIVEGIPGGCGIALENNGLHSDSYERDPGVSHVIIYVVHYRGMYTCYQWSCWEMFHEFNVLVLIANLVIYWQVAYSPLVVTMADGNASLSFIFYVVTYWKSNNLILLYIIV